jgi:hypothetical protein
MMKVVAARNKEFTIYPGDVKMSLLSEYNCGTVVHCTPCSSTTGRSLFCSYSQRQNNSQVTGTTYYSLGLHFICIDPCKSCKSLPVPGTPLLYHLKMAWTHQITPCFDQTHLIQNPTNFSRFCCMINNSTLGILTFDIVVLDDKFINLFEM